MLKLQSPRRTRLSRRVARAGGEVRNIADYVESLRGTRDTWGPEGQPSPQWWAGEELIRSGLADKLRDQLQASTRIRKLASGASRDRVVSRYVADNAALGDQLEAINRMFRTIAFNQTNAFAPELDLNQSDDSILGRNLQDARKKFTATLFASKGAHAVLGPHLITADFLTAHRDTLLVICRDDIAKRCTAIAGHVVRCLVQGLADGLLGLVVWPAEDLCWYVRSERRLWLAGHWFKNVYDHFHVTKEVHLMDAMHLRGIPGWLNPPDQVQNVLNAIPPIFHPHLGTVVGTMVKEREIRWLMGQAAYQPKNYVMPQREIVFDPAIVIGPVVLTGWELPEHTRPGWWMRLDTGLAKRRSSSESGAGA